jgi:hypothetical protein
LSAVGRAFRIGHLGDQAAIVQILKQGDWYIAISPRARRIRHGRQKFEPAILAEAGAERRSGKAFRDDG